MKIVIISPYQFRLHRGIERFTYSIANKLAERGMAVTLYSWGATGEPADWGNWHPGVKLRRAPAVRYYQSMLASRFYKAWLRKDKPDVVVLNFLYHGEHLLPVHHRYLYILHSPASEVPSRYDFIRQHMKRFASMEFIAVSEMVKREAMPYLADRRITVIRNGVDTSLFVPAESKAKKNNGDIKLITAAALEERKGIQHIIRLLGGLPPEHRRHIRYDIYGEGPYKNVLQALIGEFGLEETVVIKAVVNNLHDVLPAYDLFCLMSKGEAMPLAPLEAIACGVPVLTSAYPPFDEFITPDIGLAVHPDDHQQILQFIAGCKNGQHEQLCAAARTKSLQFSWEAIIDKYIEQLQNCAVL